LSGTISIYTIGSTSTVASIVPVAMATVVNYGKIVGPLYQAQPSGGTGGTAVQFNGGGLITNALGGTIVAGTGIGASHVVATVVNAGRIGVAPTIVGPDVWSGTALGISLGAGGLVTNASGGGIYGYGVGV
jgi:hypothetical protein